MSQNPGSGWVVAVLRGDYVLKVVVEHCAKNPRNDLTELERLDGLPAVLWRRDPDTNGKGVAKDSEVSDFIRLVSYASHCFPVSTVANTKHPIHFPDYWPFREDGKHLVSILDHGWNPTKTETDQDIVESVRDKIKLEITLNDDGTVSGTHWTEGE